MSNTTRLFRGLFLSLLFTAPMLLAGEADIKIPDLNKVGFQLTGTNATISGPFLMYAGLIICVLGALFGVKQYTQTKNLPVHERMRNVSNIIWETCKTYLAQQGKFLVVLWVLIALCMV